MKLKKIASLMLAGVMAVSMLAACGDSSSSSSEGTTAVTTNNNITSIVNAAIKGNDAGISFTSDAEVAKALEIVIREKGVNDTEDNYTAAMATELDVTNATFTAAALNTSTDDKSLESVIVYKVSGKNESALSAAYKVADKVNAVVSSLAESTASNSDIFDYTYSNAYISMLEVTVDDTNYYFVAVTLNSDCNKR